MEYSFLFPVLVYYPIVILIHEFGHAVIGNVYGKKLKLIILGRGNKLIRIKKLQINMYFFWGGTYIPENGVLESKSANIMILLGGILANIAMGIILLVLIRLTILNGYIWRDFMGISFVCGIGSLIPYSFEGRNTDGKQIYQMIKYGYSTLNSKYNRNLREFKLVNESYKLESMEKYEEAMMKVDEALQINNEFNLAYYQKGNILIKMKSCSEAFDIYNRLLVKDPEDLAALSGISVAYVYTGNYDKCLEYNLKALNIDKHNAVILNNIADYYRRVGNYDKAMLYIEEALDIDNYNGVTYSTLSEIYLGKGDMESFYKSFEKALRLDYKVEAEYEKDNYGKVAEEQRYKDLIRKYCCQE